ncbi:hypothetical protein DL98DRAFT_522626 [Cadophora sp. DSE1049]|nr:hypothetical protein DL98DRAFT_522626 [Cadophora sp. DSE1049]
MAAHHPLGDSRWRPSYIFVYPPSLLHLLSSKPLTLNHHRPSLYLSPPPPLAAIAWAAGSSFTSSALLLYF